MKFFVALLVLWVVACGGASSPIETGAFSAAGLKLVIGVERTKTFEVKSDGSVVSSQTGNTAMTFVGQELRLPDGSKTLLTLDGDTLRGPSQSVGTFSGDALVLGGVNLSVKDDGEVEMVRDGSSKKMRMHFEGSTVGRKRAALMLVAVVFAIYVATNPHATMEQFADD